MKNNMKYLLVTGLIFIFSVLTVYSQNSYISYSMVLRYEKVTKFIFDEGTQSYIPTDTVEFSGAISIDSKNIFIKGYNDKPNKILKIIKVIMCTNNFSLHSLTFLAFYFLLANQTLFRIYSKINCRGDK